MSSVIEIDLQNRLALRQDEAAEVLGISVRTLRNLTPYLPTVRMGGVLLYPVASLEEWLRQQAADQEAQADAVADQIMKEFG